MPEINTRHYMEPDHAIPSTEHAEKVVVASERKVSQLFLRELTGYLELEPLLERPDLFSEKHTLVEKDLEDYPKVLSKYQELRREAEARFEEDMQKKEALEERKNNEGIREATAAEKTNELGRADGLNSITWQGEVVEEDQGPLDIEELARLESLSQEKLEDLVRDYVDEHINPYRVNTLTRIQIVTKFVLQTGMRKEAREFLGEENYIALTEEVKSIDKNLAQKKAFKKGAREEDRDPVTYDEAKRVYAIGHFVEGLIKGDPQEIEIGHVEDEEEKQMHTIETLIP